MEDPRARSKPSLCGELRTLHLIFTMGGCSRWKTRSSFSTSFLIHSSRRKKRKIWSSICAHCEPGRKGCKLNTDCFGADEFALSKVSDLLRRNQLGTLAGHIQEMLTAGLDSPL